MAEGETEEFDPLKYVSEFLTVDDVVEYWEAFSEFDYDQSGSIDHSELGACLKSVGVKISARQLKETIEEIDADNSGDVDFNEFLDLMTRRATENTEDEDLQNAFEQFDKNGSKFIEVDDLKKLLNSLGEKISDRDAEEMIRLADYDGDGVVSFDDYKQLMLSFKATESETKK